MRFATGVLICGSILVAVAPLLGAGDERTPGSIGLNFPGAGHMPVWGTSGLDGSIPADVSAGVFPQKNWNNAPLNAATGSLEHLNDASGTGTTASASWKGAVTFDCGGSLDRASGDQQLMYGYLDTRDDSTTTVNMEKIPFAKYKVLVYVVSFSPGRVGHVTLGAHGSSIYYKTIAGNPRHFKGRYIRGEATKAGDAAPANYVQFDNVSGPSIVVTNMMDGDDLQNVGLAAVEIIDQP